MTAPAEQERADGLFASVQRLGASVLGLLHTRLELVAVELQEEKLRALSLLAGFALAVALGAAGLLLALGLLALFLWQKTGYVGPVALAVVLLAAAWILFARLRAGILHGPHPFAATCAELARDRASLSPRP